MEFNRYRHRRSTRIADCVGASSHPALKRKGKTARKKRKINKLRALGIFHEVFPHDVVNVHRITVARFFFTFAPITGTSGDSWIIVFTCKDDMLRTGGSSHIASVSAISGKLVYLGLAKDGAE